MKYPKDPYYLNSELRNKQKNNENIHDPNFYMLVHLLKKDNAKQIYEVGFDFGQRLLVLKEEGLDVLGGIEFDPNFGLYKRHVNLFDHGWDIKFMQLDYWSPTAKETIITNNFLSIFPKDYRQELLEKLLNTSAKLYLNESCTLDFEQTEDNIYVIDGKRNDIQSASKGIEKKEPELPDTKSFRDRLNKETSTDFVIEETTTESDDSSGSV